MKIAHMALQDRWVKMRKQPSYIETEYFLKKNFLQIYKHSFKLLHKKNKCLQLQPILSLLSSVYLEKYNTNLPLQIRTTFLKLRANLWTICKDIVWKLSVYSFRPFWTLIHKPLNPHASSKKAITTILCW